MLSLWKKLIDYWYLSVDTLMGASLCLKVKCEEKKCRLLYEKIGCLTCFGVFLSSSGTMSR